MKDKSIKLEIYAHFDSNNQYLIKILIIRKILKFITYFSLKCLKNVSYKAF